MIYILKDVRFSKDCKVVIIDIFKALKENTFEEQHQEVA